ncbi:hypothetical protein [Xenorhabdus sp. SGI246]|uniref:hypothetical protein n=1 Tax=Xenorhabdus sp. SGI246 TaxID=3158263 RepID=UPI00349FAFD7
MMLVETAILPIPNQTTSFTIDSDLIDLTLESRLGAITPHARVKAYGLPIETMEKLLRIK